MPKTPKRNEVEDTTFRIPPVVKKPSQDQSLFGKIARLAEFIAALTAAGPGKITQTDLNALHRTAQDVKTSL